MVHKSDNETLNEIDMKKDHLIMNEMINIADSVIMMLKTEADYPTYHPELYNELLMLNLSVWVEKVIIPAPGTEDDNLHSNCSGGVFLPLGLTKHQLQGMENVEKPATRFVHQINNQLFSNPLHKREQFLPVPPSLGPRKEQLLHK